VTRRSVPPGSTHHVDMSTASTRPGNVSICAPRIDTSRGWVEGIDTTERRQHTAVACRGQSVRRRGGAVVAADVPGFCKSASLEEVRKHGHVLTPGSYVGAEAQEDDGEPFNEKAKRLPATLHEQQAEAAKLDAATAANLKEIGYGG